MTAKQKELIYQAFFSVLQYADPATVGQLRVDMEAASLRVADPRLDLFIEAADAIVAPFAPQDKTGTALEVD